MNKKETIGTISKEELNKIERKLSRQEEIDLDPSKGFKSTHSVTPSKKTYKRCGKHKGRGY